MRESQRQMKRQFEAEEAFDLADADNQRKLRFEEQVGAHVLEILQKHYPGYGWSVKVDIYVERNHPTLIGVIERYPGAVQIMLPQIMPPTKMYNIPMALLNTENDFQTLVMRAGGEILERFGMKRGGINFDDFEAARPQMVMDHRTELPN